MMLWIILAAMTAVALAMVLTPLFRRPIEAPRRGDFDATIYREQIADSRGLGSQCPWLCVMMAICLFSLVGLPPLGGFVAKFFVLAPVWEAASLHWSMGVLVGFALLNTVFSLFYYLRIPVAMFIKERPEGARVARIETTERTFVLLLTVPILLLGMSPLIGKLSEAAERVARDTISATDTVIENSSPKR